jgi:hypothetical protein
VSSKTKLDAGNKVGAMLIVAWRSVLFTRLTLKIDTNVLMGRIIGATQIEARQIQYYD